jgi:hypothetical protein
MNKTKKTIFSILAGIAVSPIAHAMSYPEMGGITLSSTTTAAEYIVYFFNLSVAVGATLAVVMLVMAGLEYVLSRGDVTKVQDARKRIQNSLLGLVILLGSYILLQIINPQLTKISVTVLPRQEYEETTVPEGKGVYLYDGEGFVSSGDPLILTETKSNFNKESFKTKSIKFLNPDNYSFGAILFDSDNLEGNCSYILNNLSSVSSASGSENNPAIGSVSSIQVFETKTGTASVKLYNSINCSAKVEDYCRSGDADTPCQPDSAKTCTLNSGTGFENISAICPNFDNETGVLSIEVSGNVGILLKAADKNSKGRCQFFTPGNSVCINTVKYSYIFRNDYSRTNNTLSDNITIPSGTNLLGANLNSIIKNSSPTSTTFVKFRPVSFMLFPLYSK